MFLQLRLISYSSVDSFIKRDYVLDILDKYKINPKIFERLQTQTRDQSDVDLNIFDWKLETKRHLMNTEKGFLVQHRREYYNDFEDCLREYKNAKIKSLQKQTKVHLSDGDNNPDSDSEYVDCSESNDLKHQSTLSSKSMPHVPSGNYEDNFCQKLEVKPTTLHQETKAQKQVPPTTQSTTNSDSREAQIEHETLAQLTTHNDNHNQIINTSFKNTSTKENHECKVSQSDKKSMAINDNVHIPTTSIHDINVHVNQKTADKQSKRSEAVQDIVKKDEQTKRKSCKKKVDGAVKDPTQR